MNLYLNSKEVVYSKSRIVNSRVGYYLYDVYNYKVLNTKIGGSCSLVDVFCGVEHLIDFIYTSPVLYQGKVFLVKNK